MSKGDYGLSFPCDCSPHKALSGQCSLNALCNWLPIQRGTNANWRMVLSFIFSETHVCLKKKKKKTQFVSFTCCIVAWRLQKTEKKINNKEKQTTTVWRVSRVAAINIDVRADVTGTGQRYGEGHRCEWPESGRPSCYPLKLYQRTVCSLLSFFVYWGTPPPHPPKKQPVTKDQKNYAMFISHWRTIRKPPQLPEKRVVL